MLALCSVLQFNGSLVVVPLTSPQQRVVGTCSVDTLTDRSSAETSFSTHEINFYQVHTFKCKLDMQKWFVSAVTPAFSPLLGSALCSLCWCAGCGGVSGGGVPVDRLPAQVAASGPVSVGMGTPSLLPGGWGRGVPRGARGEEQIGARYTKSHPLRTLIKSLPVTDAGMCSMQAEEGFTLRVMLETTQEDSRGGDRQISERMRRKDNIFKCVVGTAVYCSILQYTTAYHYSILQYTTIYITLLYTVEHYTIFISVYCSMTFTAAGSISSIVWTPLSQSRLTFMATTT